MPKTNFLQRGRNNELKLNEDYMKQKSGRPVLFGDTIQLYHLKSKKYLSILPKKLAFDERENLKVTLRAGGDPFSWFNVVPRYKIDREGDIIVSGVEILLKASLRQSEYVHVSEKRPRQGLLFNL